jgi:hypothetical protein
MEKHIIHLIVASLLFMLIFVSASGCDGGGDDLGKCKPLCGMKEWAYSPRRAYGPFDDPWQTANLDYANRIQDQYQSAAQACHECNERNNPSYCCVKHGAGSNQRKSGELYGAYYERVFFNPKGICCWDP